MTRDKDELLDTPLPVLGLTLRTYNALLNNGLHTFGGVLAATEVELLAMPVYRPGPSGGDQSEVAVRGLALRAK